MAKTLFVRLLGGLNAQRLVLLRLWEVHRRARNEDELMGATRSGLAGFFGTSAPSMSMYLTRLVHARHAVKQKQRFRGHWRSVELFVLTANGAAEAAKVDSKARSATVMAMGKRTSISLLLQTLPERTTVAEIVRYVREGVFDHEGFARAHVGPVPKRRSEPGIGVSTPFVGRHKERERVVQFLADRKSGVLIVDGLPGIGKTSLVSVATGEWLRGVSPVWHDFAAGAGSEDLVASVSAALLDRGRPALDRFLRSGATQNRRELMPLLRRELIASPSVVVVLDNVQLASEDAIEAVREVCGAAARHHSLKLVLVCRDRSSAFPLALAGGGDRIQQMIVGPLEPQDAETLWRRLKGVGDAAHVATAVGGNPHLMTLVAATGAPPDSAHVEELLEKELLPRMESAERRAMEALAAARGTAQLELLNALGLTSNETLRRLAARHLVKSDGYGFFSLHDTLRAAVLRSMTPSRLEELDRQAVEHLCAVGRPRALSQAAFHLGRLRDSILAAKFLVRYGSRLLGGGYVSAVDSLLGIALGGPASGLERSGDLAELYLLRGGVLSSRGELASAVDAFAAAESADGAGAWAVARSRAEGAVVLHRLGRLEDAARKLVHVEIPPGVLGYEEASVRFSMGTTCEALDKLDLALKHYEACVAVGSSNAGPLSQLGLARVLWKRGKYEEAADGFALARELAVDAGEKETAANAAIWQGSAISRPSDEKLSEAIEVTRLGLAEAEEIGLLRSKAYALNSLADYLCRTGEPDKALECAREAAELFADFAEVGMAVGSKATLAKSLVSRGEKENALTLVREIIRV